MSIANGVLVIVIVGVAVRGVEKMPGVGGILVAVAVSVALDVGNAGDRVLVAVAPNGARVARKGINSFAGTEEERTSFILGPSGENPAGTCRAGRSTTAAAARLSSDVWPRTNPVKGSNSRMFEGLSHTTSNLPSTAGMRSMGCAPSG